MAGNGTSGSTGDGGQATAAELRYPDGLALDSSGDLLITDFNSNRIRKVNGTGVISTLAGNGTSGYSGDGGPATAARMMDPEGLAVDSSGNVYFADCDNNAIRRVNTAGVISTVAGGSFDNDGQPASAAYFNQPQSVVVDAAGDVFIADCYGQRMREINHVTGIVSTVAGTGILGYSGDGGQATAAQLSFPHAITLDGAGNLYIADSSNDRIRKVNLSTGVITTVAGDGSGSFSGDGGAATAAGIDYPEALTVDAAGDIFIADTDDFRIREVNAATHIISTVAGTGTSGYSGDAGQATAAKINYCYGLALDASGNLYISDTSNYRIRRVNLASGVITTIAGTGTFGSGGDGGQATAATIGDPGGLAFDAAGNLYIADYGKDRVRKVNTVTGVITTLAGTGTGGSSGDGGPATAANLNGSRGVAVDAAGDVYIADSGNDRIQELAAPANVVVAGATASAVTGPVTATYGSKLSVSATLTDGAAALAGQLVTFSLNGSSVGTAVTNVSGVASLSGISLAGYSAGTYTSYVSAAFAGFWSLPAASATANLVVTAAPTATRVAATPAAIAFGQSATLAVTVTAAAPGGGTPSGGTVTFYDNGTAVGTATLSGGTATLVTTALLPGTAVITAGYAGDGLNFLGSTSAPVSSPHHRHPGRQRQRRLPGRPAGRGGGRGGRHVHRRRPRRLRPRDQPCHRADDHRGRHRHSRLQRRRRTGHRRQPDYPRGVAAGRRRQPVYCRCQRTTASARST